MKDHQRLKGRLYSVVVVNETDARKKPRSFMIRKEFAVLAAVFVVLLVAAAATAAFFVLAGKTEHAEEIDRIRSNVEEQSDLLDAYAKELAALRRDTTHGDATGDTTPAQESAAQPSLTAGGEDAEMAPHP